MVKRWHTVHPRFTFANVIHALPVLNSQRGVGRNDNKNDSRTASQQEPTAYHNRRRAPEYSQGPVKTTRHDIACH